MSVAISDLNADDVPDLAVANQGSASVSVLLGVGGGVFVPQDSYSVGDQPFDVAIGDLNGDLVPDLATPNLRDDNVGVHLNKLLE